MAPTSYKRLMSMPNRKKGLFNLKKARKKQKRRRKENICGSEIGTIGEGRCT